MQEPASAGLNDGTEAISAVDDILANVGLAHGTRSTRKNTWHAGERRPIGKPKSAAAKLAAGPNQTPEILTAPNLRNAEDLIHGFSTRTGGFSRIYRPNLPANTGDLNLGYTPQDDPALVRKNRTRFLTSLQATGFHRFALLQQKHTPIVRILRSPGEAAADFLQPATMQGDAFITDCPGVLLTIQTADCIPVLLYDPVRRAIAAFHAGWRGTLARIVERGVGTMQLLYGSKPKDILAAIGPGIGPASYAVSEDVRHDFESQFAYAPSLFHDVDDADPIREKYPLLFSPPAPPATPPSAPNFTSTCGKPTANNSSPPACKQPTST